MSLWDGIWVMGWNAHDLHPRSTYSLLTFKMEELNEF